MSTTPRSMSRGSRAAFAVIPLRRWLSSPRAAWWIVLLGVALTAPALGVGFAVDDHIHRVLSRPHTGIAGLSARPLDLFVFSTGNEAENHALIDEGVFPWWTSPHAKLAFMRPISSLSHALDHALWPESAPLQQAHSLVWFALVLVLLAVLYRRLFAEPWLAALALLLYAVDDARGPTVGWIANRNASIALALALPVLLLHRRYREAHSRSAAWLAPLCLLLALLAGESALAITAYLAAYALVLDTGGMRSRILSLLPYALVVVAWRFMYSALGYGAAGSSVYIDPAASPRAFALALVTRLPLLLQSQLGAPWSDLAGLYPFLGPHVLAMAVLSCTLLLLGLAWIALPLLRTDRLARFFALGMLLAAVPICSTFPADRLLSFVAIGGAGFLACLLGWVANGLTVTGARRSLTLVMASLLVFVHLVLSPPALALRARSMVTVEKLMRRAPDSLPRGPGVRDKTIVVVNSPGDPFFGYLLMSQISRHLERPKHLRWLATGLSAVKLERLDARTLRISPEGGFLQFEMDRMLRDASDSFHAGDVVALTDLTLTIERVDASGLPLTVRATFARPLDDSTLVFMRWSGLGLVPYLPPTPGQSQVLPAIDFVQLLADSEQAPPST
jgi:hypothetical protein